MKRFTDTEKWSDPWYRKLTPIEKCFWAYICDKCDNCGVWKPDFESASFFVGSNLVPESLHKTFKDRIIVLSCGSWLIKKFVLFQFVKLNHASRVHQSVMSLLDRHGIAYDKGIDRLYIGEQIAHGYPQGQVQGKGTGTGKGGVGGEEVPTLKQAIDQTMSIGATPDFVEYVYQDWVSRDGCDATGAHVRWVLYVAKRWSRERSQWMSGTHKGKKTEGGNGIEDRMPPDVDPAVKRRIEMEKLEAARRGGAA